MLETPREILPLSALELDCARVIYELTSLLGRGPTYAEIARELDLKSKSGVHRLVMQLKAKGWLADTRRYRSGGLKLLVPVPMPLDFVDVREIANIALQAVEGLQRMMGNTGLALDLATRLKTAVGREQRAEITPAGRQAVGGA